MIPRISTNIFVLGTGPNNFLKFGVNHTQWTYQRLGLAFDKVTRYAFLARHRGMTGSIQLRLSNRVSIGAAFLICTGTA